jgi:hypothetical protein
MALTNETLELVTWNLEQGYIITYLYMLYKILMENHKLKDGAMKNIEVVRDKFNADRVGT